MGLMDNIKNAQDMAKQAQEAAAGAPGAGAGMGMGPEDMAYAQKMQSIATTGVDCKATIESITDTGKTDPSGANQFAIGVEVEKDGEAPYKATVNQYLQPDAVASYTVGTKFNAKHDGADPSFVLLYGYA